MFKEMKKVGVVPMTTTCLGALLMYNEYYRPWSQVVSSANTCTMTIIMVIVLSSGGLYPGPWWHLGQSSKFCISRKLYILDLHDTIWEMNICLIVMRTHTPNSVNLHDVPVCYA